MNNKPIIFPIIFFSLFCCANAGAQVKTTSVSTSRTVINGRVTEEITVYDSTKKISSKAISMQVPCAANATVNINNAYRKIKIMPATGNTLRMETTAYYTGNVNLTDAAWFDKLNIKMQGSNDLINITSGGVAVSSRGNYSAYSEYESYPSTSPTARTTTTASGETITTITITGKGRTSTSVKSSNSNSVAVYNEDGTMRSAKISAERVLIVYLPAGADLHINSKYANVAVGFDAARLDVKILSASLDMQNAATAKIDCSYGSIRAGNIKDAVITLTSGKLFTKDLGNADLNTKYSQVETGSCSLLKINSTSDEYDLDEVKSFTVVKSYGSMKIGKLSGYLQLKGTSADLKIKNIDPQVSQINIDNRYADLRLPVSSLKNYSVNFSGSYSNIYAPFSIKASPDDAHEGSSASGSTGTGGTILAAAGDNNFTATQGDTKGTHTSFTIKCLSCSLDFK